MMEMFCCQPHIKFRAETWSARAAPDPAPEMMRPNMNDFNEDRKTGFGSDFFTGCLGLVLLVVVLVVVLPALIFVFKIGFTLAILAAAVLLVIILIAFFGRIINLLRSRW